MGTTSDGRPTRLVCARGALIDVFATTRTANGIAPARATTSSATVRPRLDLAVGIGRHVSRSRVEPAERRARARRHRQDHGDRRRWSRMRRSPDDRSRADLVSAADSPHVLVTGKNGTAGAAGETGSRSEQRLRRPRRHRRRRRAATTILLGWTSRPNGEKLVLADITTSDGHDDLRALFARGQKLQINATGGVRRCRWRGRCRRRDLRRRTTGRQRWRAATAETAARAAGHDSLRRGESRARRRDRRRCERWRRWCGRCWRRAGTGPSDNAALGGGGATAAPGHVGHDGPKPIVRAGAGISAKLDQLSPREDAQDVAPDSERHYDGDLTTTLGDTPPHTESVD